MLGEVPWCGIGQDVTSCFSSDAGWHDGLPVEGAGTLYCRTRLDVDRIPKCRLLLLLLFGGQGRWCVAQNRAALRQCITASAYPPS